MIKNANWITGGIHLSEAPEFVRRFVTDRKIKRAELTITAIGVYEAYINGERIGDFVFAPGCTAYNKRIQYQSYDVTDMIRTENELFVIVGKGWHRGRISEGRKDINTKLCAIIAVLEIIYEDNSKKYIYTDEKWTVRETGVIFNDFYDGEVYDARDINDVSVQAQIIELDKNILIPQEGEKVCEKEIIKPVGFIITPKGERVIDFGQNLTGYIHFNVTAVSSDVIEISHAEILDSDGNFYTENYRSAKAKLKYICTDGEQNYKPHFSFYGFRYIRLDEYPDEVDLDDFEAIVVYSDIKRTGYIKSSNEKLNRLFENTIWSQKDNFLDIPTDCPQRDERMGWLGDAQVFAKTASYNFDVCRFFKKWMADMRAEQFEDGKVPVTVPNFWNWTSISAAWSDAVAIIPWQMYMMYGDKSFLEDNFEAIKKWVDFIAKDTLDEYLWTCSDDEKKMNGKHCGDWLGLDAPEGSFRGSTDDDIIASAFYAHCTDILIKAGKIIGKDVSEYEKLYRNIRKAFAERFTNKLKTQTEHVMALNFNLSEDMKKTAHDLNNMIVQNGYKLTTGFVGTPYLLYALSDTGYTDTAYRLLLQEEYPSWLYEVNNGATTIWEHWDGIRSDGTFWSKDMNSYNHYAYGAVIDWVYSVAGGIRPDEEFPGFERVIIEPKAGNELEWLDVSLDTKYGTVRSKWEHFEDRIKYEIETPVPAVIIIDDKTLLVECGQYIFYGER